MKKLSTFILIFMLFVFSSTFAQKVIKGTINSDGAALPGANIKVKEAPEVVSTSDIAGNFTINVPENGKTLIVSFVGLKDKEVEIGNSTDVYIKMKATAKHKKAIVKQMIEATVTIVVLTLMAFIIGRV